MTKAAFRGWLVAAGVALGLAACNGDGSDTSGPKPCSSNDQCSGLEQCMDGVCRTTCATDDDCAAGEYCNADTGACTPGCRDDTECPGADICQKGSCLNPDADSDGDGFTVAVDCDDTNPAINPGAQETCNGVDDNCNGLTDEALPLTDLAAKQQGVCKGTHKVCAGKDGWVEPDYASVVQGYEANEVSCDGLDNDCDGQVDEGLVPPPADLHVGVCAGMVKHCAGTSGWQEPDYTLIAGYEPYETGGCDGIDSNCDGTADEQWDADHDGYYTDTNATCASFYKASGLVDCDDGDPNFNKSCVVYVNGVASGLGDGTSWTNAFTHLHDALAVVKSGYQVWVAKGTYRPDQGIGVVTGDVYASFSLPSNVEVYGGFTGIETSLTARDWVANKTVLSGDLAGNDGPSFANRSDNSRHVLMATTGGVIDGFWVTGGNASDGGGALYGAGPSQTVTIRNATFADNQTSGTGGAISLSWSSGPTIVNTTFIGNHAGQQGGAIYCYWSSSATIVDSRFIANTAASDGGAIYTYWDSAPSVYGSLFDGNVSGGMGGAVVADWSSPPAAFINDTFANNSATLGGGAVQIDSTATATITNGVLFGNGTSALSGTAFTVGYTCLEGGSLGTGNTTLTQSPFVDSNGVDNIAGNADDDLHLVTGSSCIDSGNNAAVPAVLTVDLDGHPRINGTVDRGAYEK